MFQTFTQLFLCSGWWMCCHCWLWRDISTLNMHNRARNQWKGVFCYEKRSENETEYQTDIYRQVNEDAATLITPHSSRVPLLPQQRLEKTASQRGSSQWSKQCWPSHSRPSPRGSQWWWPAASSWMTGNMLWSCDVCLHHLEVLKASASPLAVVATKHSSSHLNGFFSSSVMKFNWFLRMQKSQQMEFLHSKWAPTKNYNHWVTEFLLRCTAITLF